MKDMTPVSRLPRDFVDFCRAYAPLAGLPETLETTEPETSVRVNSSKGVAVPEGAERVGWHDSGFYLPERPAFTFDPCLHQGLYYVQDASSMAVGALASRLTAGRGPMVCLDACAAPGGKTTAVADALPEGSLLLANEYDGRRAAALAENIERWGLPSVMVCRGDTKCFAAMNGMFDLILADVPCSGEGMMRKEAEAVAQWSPGLVAQCARLQREIVADLWPSLREGGYMIYSTCTFNLAENEENVRWICDELGAENLDNGLCDFPGIVPALDSRVKAARFIPGKIRGEGLFVALLRKTAPSHGHTAGSRKRQAPSAIVDKKIVKEVRLWLSGDYALEMADATTLRATPASIAQTIRDLSSMAGGILSAGVELAQIKGRDLIPSYALARSLALNPAAFASAEVSWEQAVAYLRREAVQLDGAPCGIVLLSYRGRPLGFVKNLGNRANNLMPASRRILSAAVPPQAPFIL